MGVYEIQGPDGKVYEVEAGSIEQAAQAFTQEPAKPEAPPWGYVGEPGNYRPDVDGGGRLAALGRLGLQGLTFGAGDEIVARGASILSGRPYEQELEFERERVRQNREDYPGMSTAAEIGGAVATGLLPLGAGAQLAARAPKAAQTVGRVAAKAPLATRMGASAAEGAGMAGLYGFNAGEGGFSPRADAAGDAAALGAVGGAVIPAMGAGLHKMGAGARNIFTGGVEAVTGRGNERKAVSTIAATLRKAGMTADEAQAAIETAAREGQPDFRLMDAAGLAGQRRASGVVRAGGEGAEEIAEFLQQRAIDAPDRMAGFVDDAFPAGAVGDVANSWVSSAPRPPSIAKPQTAEQAKAALKIARRAANDVTYGAARGAAGPVNLNKAVSGIDAALKRDPLIDGKALRSTDLGRRLLAVRSQMTDGSKQLIDFDTVLNVKEDLGAVIEGIKRRNEGVHPAIAQLYSDLDAALEASTPLYRAANDAARGMREVAFAVDEGAAMAKRGGRLEDTVSRFAAMTPEQQVAARAGYGDKVVAGIQGTQAEAPNVARAFASSKRKAEANAMAVDPGLFMRRVGREADMAKTYARALGGSRTADNLADIEDLSVLSSAGRAIRDVGTGNVPGALGNAASAVGKYVGPVVTGQTAPTRKLIAEALMANNTRPLLSSVNAAQRKDATTRAIIERLLRAQLAQTAAN